MKDDQAPIQTKVTTSHWGAFEVHAKGDRIVGTSPFMHDPEPSSIPNIIPQAVHHRNRIIRPSIRRGWLKTRDRHARGDDTHVEVPWDEALDIAASELERVRRTYGNEAIFGGSYGWASAGRFHHALGQLHRFLNTIGGYVSSFGSYSTGCAQAIMPHVFGVPFLKYTYTSQDSWQTIAEHTETLVMFGGVNPKNSQVSMGGITEHETSSWFRRFHEKNIRCINIGPQRDDAPVGCEWMPVRPASDTALMLALAYVIEQESLTDNAFLQKYTVGFNRFRSYLMGETDNQPKTPEWAEMLCEVKSSDIRNLARTMAKTRTLITVAWSLQRGQHGEQPYWMSAVLAAMLGQIGLPGGGVGYGYGAIGGIGKSMKRLEGMTLDQGENPVKQVIPVARIADLLLKPGTEYDFNGQRSTYPNIRLVYWAGGNPFHHHQDLNRLHEAWKTPETIIVNEPWWTPTAKRADIVFPATTSYEREDIGRTNMDNYLFHMPQIISPVGEARDDYEIFSEIAHRMQVGHTFTEGRNVEGWLRNLYSAYADSATQSGIEIPEFDELRERNWVKLSIQNESAVPSFLTRFRDDPEGHALDTPSGKIEIFSERVDGFGYDDCPGHPVWLPPEEWLGNATEKAPLHLVSPQPGDKLHSQLESALADVKGARPEILVINPEDASPRSIEDGDLIKVHNNRGTCHARAKISEDISCGVVALPTGAWFAGSKDVPDPHGNPNVLTLDVGTSSLGQGCSAHTALVEVSKL
jgi:biotin/methionine sulfoxide reductase